MKFELLSKIFGYNSFRIGQEELIDALNSKQDVLGIMPTGGGKSICFQIPALMSTGITLVVSPLISLMHDQVMNLKQNNVPAAYINSSLSNIQINKVIENSLNGLYKIIYLAPERLLLPEFIKFAKQSNISMLIVDEAHCISQWGHDFRQSYLDIKKFIDLLDNRPTIGAFTATATDKVSSDIVLQLGLMSPFVFKASFNRSNLFFDVVNIRYSDKFKYLLQILATEENKSGIIYCSTIKDVDNLYVQLCNCGYKATRYHSKLDVSEKSKNQRDFLYDDANIMIATNAFGMGIDKPNVSFVIHYNLPKDMESYYQEAGRAGRDGSEAKCVLMYCKRDIKILEHFINNSKYNDNISSDVIRNSKDKLKAMINYCNEKRCYRKYILNYFGEKHDGKCKFCGNCLSPTNKKIEYSNILDKYYTNAQSKVSENNHDDRLYSQLVEKRKNLAIRTGVPPYSILSDKILHDLATYKPINSSAFMKINGIGENKFTLYGFEFISTIKDYLSKDF